MYLNKEEESILGGEQGEMLSKLLKLIVRLGESYGAEKLIDIVSAHTVLNFGLKFVTAASEILHQMVEAGLRVRVPTSTDPVIDMDYSEDLSLVYSIFTLQDQLIEDLEKIGVKGYTCTPYFIGNLPNFGDHCAWSESSAVIYINSIIGARSNREGGLVDLACAITGKTSYHGLHVTENRKGEVLFKISPDIDVSNGYNLTSIGMRIGEIAGNRIPVIKGLNNVTKDEIKNLGAASAATGAVALIHVIGLTPEANTLEEAFNNEKPEETVELEIKDLEEVRHKYNTNWKKQPKNIAVGCPQLSRAEVIDVINKLKGKKILKDRNFWICTNPDVKKWIQDSDFNITLEQSGAKITSFCPTLTTLPRPLITNSAKTCFYTPASYRDLDFCIKIATEDFGFE